MSQENENVEINEEVKEEVVEEVKEYVLKSEFDTLTKRVRTLYKEMIYVSLLFTVAFAGFAYVGIKINERIAEIYGSSNTLINTVSSLMEERALTSQIDAEFKEWADTEEGQKWIEEYEKSQNGESSDVIEKVEESETEVESVSE